MSSDVEEPPKQTAASLVSGILGDLQQLVEQQFQLTRGEIEAELRQRGAAVLILALGVGVLYLDFGVLCLALIHLLHWIASLPTTDPAWLPLWACHAVVAGALFMIGGILVAVGRRRFQCVEPCQNPATELFKEHLP